MQKGVSRETRRRKEEKDMKRSERNRPHNSEGDMKEIREAKTTQRVEQER